MKKISTLFLLAFAALCGITSCKDDPEAINNAPEVFVDEATNLMRTSAVLTGRILAPADASIEEYGFKVSSTSDFTSADTKTYTFNDEDGLSEFSEQIADLEIGGTYFYVSYATNGLDIMTSTLKAFTTPQRSGVLLGLLEMVDEETATFKATLGDTGGGEIHRVGFCWGTDNTPTTYDKTVTTELNSDNTFTASLTLMDMEADVTYYVRAFADSDILGDGSTQTISYSRDVLEIRLEEVPEPKPAANEIWYTSTDGNIVEPPYDTTDFGANIESNIYENGKGVITFDGPVTSIGECAFLFCNLATITIPDSVTSIGNYAFQQCKSLVSISIPDNVSIIGEQAFTNCYGLKSVTIPDGVTSIGKFAFYGCYNLTSATIGNGVTSIGGGAFEYCASLTSVTIPDSVTSIGDYAFSDCTGLTSVTIPDSVTSIGDYAFSDCTGLRSATIGNGVTSIGACAFLLCSNLTSITIPDSVTSIGVAAFCECGSLTAFYGKYASLDNRCLIVDGVLNSFAPSGLTEYTIPGSVTSIGGSAFCGCTDLTSITIPDCITTIGTYAFYRCSSLTSVTIPDSVTLIGEGAFSYCSSLTAFNCRYASSDNRCLIVNGVLSSFAPAGVTEYTIPKNVTRIGAYTFVSCNNLTSIDIPNGITSIGIYAFADCISLTSVTIPYSVTSIGACAFFDCTGLTSVYCKPTNPPTSGNNMFSYFDAAEYKTICKIYVANKSVEAYKTADGWSAYTDAIVGYEF